MIMELIKPRKSMSPTTSPMVKYRQTEQATAKSVINSVLVRVPNRLKIRLII